MSNYKIYFPPFSESYKYNFSDSTTEQVSFLDAEVTSKYCTLSIDLFTKPDDTTWFLNCTYYHSYRCGKCIR